MSFFVLFLIVSVIVSIAAVAIVYVQSRDWQSAIAVAAIALVFVVGFGGRSYLTSFANEHVAVCHVNSKDRGGNEGSYRIYTENCGVLANQDSLLRGKFNSADVWNEIPDSGEVEFRIAGARVGFLSVFPNVLEVTPVNR